MNDPRGDHPSSPLDDYLDGRLDEAARRAFEQRLAVDAELREQVALQRQIEASLKRQFAAGSAESVLHRLQSASPSNNHHAAEPIRRAASQPPRRADAVPHWQRLASMELRPWQTVSALAAAVLLAVGLGWFWWAGDASFVRSGTTSEYGAGPGYGYRSAKQAPPAYYQSQVAQGFKAQWECPPARLEQITHSRFATALTYQPPTQARVKLLGASYANIFSTETVTMLARVRDQPVVVFVDRAEAVSAEDLALASDSGLHLYQRKLDSLALYELSPLDQPQLLPLFFVTSSGSGAEGGRGPSDPVSTGLGAGPGFGACFVH